MVGQGTPQQRVRNRKRQSGKQREVASNHSAVFSPQKKNGMKTKECLLAVVRLHTTVAYKKATLLFRGNGCEAWDALRTRNLQICKAEVKSNACGVKVNQMASPG